MNALRWLAFNTPLRRVLLHPRMRPIIAGVFATRFAPAAFRLDRPFAFLAAEMRSSDIGAYRLRSSGAPIVVRHGTGAPELIHEVFGHGCYVPPAELVPCIGANPHILDVGANVGMYSAFARQHWPGADIVAIEADPDNVIALRRFVALEGSGRIEVRAAAASTGDEAVSFQAGHGAGSRIGAGGRSVDGVDLLPLLAEADLVKLDIEGGEWPILADPRLADGGPLVLVMEYHRRFVDDYEALGEATARLQAAGFEVGHVRSNYWGHGMLWAWRLRGGSDR